MEMGNFSKGNTKMQNGNISTRTMIDLVEAANRIDGSAAPLVEGLDAHLHVRGQHVYSGNTTHNHIQIAKAVNPSLYKALWDSAGMPVTRLAPLLKTGIRELETNGDKYRHLDNKNNWGSVDDFLIFLRELYAACIQNPRAHYMGHS